MSENLPTNDERRHPIPATPGGEQPAEGSNPEASTEERVAGCPAAPCSASSFAPLLKGYMLVEISLRESDGPLGESPLVESVSQAWFDLQGSQVSPQDASRLIATRRSPRYDFREEYGKMRHVEYTVVRALKDLVEGDTSIQSLFGSASFQALRELAAASPTPHD